MFIELEVYTANFKDTEKVIYQFEKMGPIQETGEGRAWFMYGYSPVFTAVKFDEISKQLKAVKVN